MEETKEIKGNHDSVFVLWCAMRAHLWVFLTLTAGWTTLARFAKRVYRRGNLPGQHTYNIGVKIISKQIEALPRRGGGRCAHAYVFLKYKVYSAHLIKKCQGPQSRSKDVTCTCREKNE
jgi:hypothetical protein